MKSRIPCLAWGLLLLLFAPGLVFAQQTGTVTGRVIDADTDDTLPGATIQIRGTSIGAATDIDGSFTLENVPTGEQTVVATFVGYNEVRRSVQVRAGQTTEIELALAGATEELDEIVVTGVAVGTSTKKLGFSISKVTAEELEEVPGTDPANALRAKTPGARIVQASGQPGSAPSIRLRGTNTLSGSQEPLVVVDGAITGGSLEDIDMQSVESIEVIKGAAAASLYGSLAGNGVIQVITKRGSDEQNTTRVTVRNEVGFTQLGNTINLANHHNRTDPDNPESGAYRTECDQPPCTPNPEAADLIVDNDFAQTFDQQETVFSPNAFFTNYVSVASRQNNLNYLISFENLENGGVVEGISPYQRRNLRLNVDNQVSERVKFSASTLYSNSEGFDVEEQGQSANNVFYGALLAEPDLDLDAPPEEGIDAPFNPFAAGGNGANPLYRAAVVDETFNDERILGNLSLTYEVTDDITAEGQFSYDKDSGTFRSLTPAGTVAANPSDPESPGSLFRLNTESRVAFGTGRVVFNREFNDLNVTASGKYTYEDRAVEINNLSGTGFQASGVPRFDNIDPETYAVSNDFGATIRSEDIVGSLVLDYKDRYVLDAVLRQESVSLFGADARDEVYYRVAGAYRVTQDFTIPYVDELKLRGSYGISGSRPPFAAQYETFSVTSSGITKQTLGNREIKPADVAEYEVGLDVGFLERFYFEGTFASTTAENQVLEVPLSAAAGFQTQFQNAATLESNTLELALGGQIFQTDDWSMNMDIIFDRTRQEVTQLSRPSFNDDAGAAIPLFRVEEGVGLGVMYGNKLATSIGEIQFDDQGCAFGASGCVTRDQLTINNDGYVIEEGTQFTQNENPLYITDENGTRLVTQIGDANPDFNMGFSTTLRFKDLSLYTILDWEQGADVYNYTRQLLYFNERHGDLDQSDLPEAERRPISYYVGPLYNQASSTSHFVEDGSYMKLREVSLSYRFTNDLMERFGIANAVYDAKLSFIGRNLLTLTGYNGFDPEVGTETADQPSNYKIDDFAYPNFRTFSASFEVRF